MRGFVLESLRDLSIGLVVGVVIALLIERQAAVGSIAVLGLGTACWIVSLVLKSREG